MHLWLEHQRFGKISGSAWVLGVDEVGRGPLAGPVVAACCAVNLDSPFLKGVQDSKRLTSPKRQAIRREIREMHPVFLAAQSSQEIDTLGIGFCNAEVLRLAVSSAVSWLSSQAVPNAIWVDGNLKFDCPAAWPVEWVIKGDQLSYAIACASVVAKQVRDYWMIRAASRFSGYGFEDHKGYATQKHLRAIREHGLSPIHRRSFCQTLLHPQTTWLGDR